MTKTRSMKAAAGEPDDTAEDAMDTSQPLAVAVPDDIDEDAIAELIPDFDFSSVTAEDIINLLRQFHTRCTELSRAEQDRDEARAETERKDVELDQALQDKERLSRELETTAEEVQQELSKVKQERDQLVNEKASWQSQLSALATSQTSSSSEVESLKQHIEAVEREKRDLLVVITRLKDESSQRDEEIQTLRANLKEARQEHQTLETQVRELRSNETATKFKIDSLSQQLQLAQAEVERTNEELTTKTEDFAKYRRTKHAETANLQASLDSLTQAQASTEASLKAIQSAHTTQGHQLVQALDRVQSLTSQLAEQEARYSNEAAGLKRLVTMMEEREKQAKDIVENIEQEWAAVGEKAERREMVLKEEIERHKKAREEAEERLERLEDVLERMGRGELPTPGRPIAGSPFRTPGGPDMSIDGMLGLSPTVAIASKVQKGGKTFTEVYADYVRLQEEYATKSAEYDHMDRTLSSVLAQIEERAPILSQQRIEYERLQVEASQLGAQLAQAISDRDSQAKLAQEQSAKVKELTNESRLLQGQLEDLGLQVQNLARELARRDDPTIPAELPDDLPKSAADTQNIITNELVLFNSIPHLQEQNIRLLKITRELTQNMESKEAENREKMEKEQAEAIGEAHELMKEMEERFEREMAHNSNLMQACVKERDTLRVLLARAQKNESSGPAPAIEIAPESQNELATQLAEVQSQFEAYKTEMGADSTHLREQFVTAQREVNQLSASLAKANAKLEYLTETHRMHQEQFRVHNLDMDELTKRNSQLHEQNVRMDIECARLADELQVTAGRLEQLRNECANLRAEKKIWESVQSRLVEENRTLAMERSHLSDLMTNVQKMHNDLERSGENDRRRLESQLQMLENQTQDLRHQLLQERDTVRHVSLQKDIELKELQKKLDKHTEDFSTTRESLIEAQTSKKHLEDKVEDLTRQLKGNEEKLAVYERRPGTVGNAEPVDQSASREEQLEAEVAELRSALKVAQVDLASAKSHKDQFQQISQASEAALADLNSTFDQYKTSAEATIARHESETKALQERLEQTSAELAQLRAQFNESQKAFEVERTAWINDKKTLEDTIVDLSTSEKNSESDRSTREQELKSLEDRAKAAEERYSHEIIAHAESMKTIETLKRDLSTAQSSARENLTAAETAQAKLSASESSWKIQKEALDKEVSDLNARCQDLGKQNTTLLEHLESVSAQATRIKQAADAPATSSAEGDTQEEADHRLSELRSVVSYLRKEKGIIELQLEMSKQENERLKVQIEHLQSNLQETRSTLAEEREKAIQNTTSAAQHAELVERINQLNLLRESNATLRGEAEKATKKARDLEIQLRRLSVELGPVKEEARLSKAELEATKAQIERLEQESKRWQERNAQLLTKYDRVDPAEIQGLKDEIAKLQAELTAAQAQLKEKETIQETERARTGRLESNFRAHKDHAAKAVQNFKSQLGEANKAKTELLEEKRQLELKVAALEQDKAAAPAEAPKPNPAEVAEIQQQAALIASLRTERDQLLAQKEALVKASNAAPAPADGSQVSPEEKAALTKARDEAQEKIKLAQQQIHRLNNEIKTQKFQNEKHQARIRELELAEKQKATTAETSAPVDTAAQEEITKRHTEELKALEDKLNAKWESEVQQRIQAAVEAHIKANPPAPATAAPPADQQAAIDAAIAEYAKKVEAQKEEELAAAVERGRLEQGTKTKLKEQQLVRATKRVKELEAQIVEWEAAGLIPATTPTGPAATAAKPTPAIQTASTATSSVPSPTTAKAPTGPAAAVARPAQAQQAAAGPSQPPRPTPATTNAATPATGNLPRRPPPQGAPGMMAQGLPGRGGAVRGMGRGGLVGRGGALRTPPVKPANAAAVTPAPTGVSIIGAASKRPREDGATTPDSLAKRLKPANEAAGPS
ncbi:hypothetical protein CVT24_003711 [Panaeolus cyanescens]|uniref:Uncharacterized protein n=1 Tax=Panaeolus cyanescens TaxID=181874 RepID=A0A409YXN7_9AGAR|nr:hypothetical protein CVT24_003711 [Panaeolus cyanescens]